MFNFLLKQLKRDSDELEHELSYKCNKADRRSPAVPPEFCFTMTALAVQGYNAILSADDIKEQIMPPSNQHLIFAGSIVKAITVSEHYDLLN